MMPLFIICIVYTSEQFTSLIDELQLLILFKMLV